MPVGISNAALYNFTKSFADLCAPQGIRVVGVAPSGVTTDRWTRLVAARAPAEGKTPEQLQAEVDAALPLGRMAHPQDVADAICFVASARAAYICGSVITVDGNSTQGVYCASKACRAPVLTQGPLMPKRQTRSLNSRYEQVQAAIISLAGAKDQRSSPPGAVLKCQRVAASASRTECPEFQKQA